MPWLGASSTSEVPAVFLCWGQEEVTDFHHGMMPTRLPQEQGGCYSIIPREKVLPGRQGFPLAGRVALPGCPRCAALSHTPSCPRRLRRLQGGDQAGPVAAGAGEAVARQLLQVPNVRDHPHRRVHQQVSATAFPGCPRGRGCAQGLTRLSPLLSLSQGMASRTASPTTTPSSASSARPVTATSAAASWR